MSAAFKGSHWRTAQFRTSHFAGVEVAPPPPPPGGEPTGGSYWLGTHWKNRQFATTHFRGVQLAPPTPPPQQAMSSSGGSSTNRKRKHPTPPQPRVVMVPDPAYSEDAALAVALLEADEI